MDQSTQTITTDKKTKKPISEAQKRASKKYYEKIKQTDKYKEQNLAHPNTFYARNKDKVLEYKKEYYERKREEIRAALLPDILI